ncbi:MAG TPA: 50S ribosomal protein L11 methyltransferase [Pyrinomonadaceae bacterium]
MYSIPDYGRMIQDRVRVEGYAQALRQKITPDSVVLDIGAGPGIFSLLACQCGAKRVYAVEPDDSIELARRTAAANGFTHKIEFIQDFSTRITLPEMVDVIVSDISGVLPFFQKHIPSIMDARTRFLKPGGVLIPAAVTLWAAVVAAPELHERHMGPWNSSIYDLDLTAGRQVVSNSWRKAIVSADQLLTKPFRWAEVDYRLVETNDIAADLSWTVERDGTAHGITAWFDSILTDQVSFSNAPGQPELIYGNGFFPWPDPVELVKDDVAAVHLQADVVGDDYVWQWNTGVRRPDHSVKAEFRQSTFNSQLLSFATLRRKAGNHIPRLNEDGEIQRFILDHMNGSNTLEEIAAKLTTVFPTRFPSIATALTAVAHLSTNYSR